MASIILHLLNEDPIVGEIDDLPAKTDYLLMIKNPRRKDGKDLPYVEQSVNTLIIPVFRVSFIEILSEKEEEIITFVRE